MKILFLFILFLIPLQSFAQWSEPQPSSIDLLSPTSQWQVPQTFPVDNQQLLPTNNVVSADKPFVVIKLYHANPEIIANLLGGSVIYDMTGSSGGGYGGGGYGGGNGGYGGYGGGYGGGNGGYGNNNGNSGYNRSSRNNRNMNNY